MVGNLALMQQINTTAQKEKDKNVPILQAGADFWTAVADALDQNHKALGNAANRVAECWRDTTHPIAFQQPVDEGLNSLEKSVQTIVQAKPQEAARTAIGQIETLAKQIAQKLAQYIEIHNLAENLAKHPDANQMGHIAQMLAQLEARMRVLEQEAADLLKNMGTQGYAPAKPSVKAAGEGHAWKGSHSASTASAASTAPGGGSGTVSSSASAGSGGTGKSEQLDPGQLDPGQVPGMGQTGTDATVGGAENISETGLAGGPATAPAPPAPPPAGVPPAGPTTPGVGAPVGAPLGGAGVIGRAAVVPAVGLGARGTSIPQAAKVPGGIVSASSGKAPSLPTEPTGAAGVSGARKPGMVGPMGMGAGVPAMLAPSAMGGLQGLINRLKPIVTRPGASRIDQPESVAGVPKGLRGRTARTNDDDAFRLGPRPVSKGRKSTTDGPPETVQLLDEEIWRVEQGNTRNATIPVRH